MKDFLSKDLPFELPCSRVVNGFRLQPVWSNHDSPFVIWLIQPNHSNRIFYFKNLDMALDFAKKYQNNHSDSFWFRKWSNYYSYLTASKYSSYTR